MGRAEAFTMEKKRHFEPPVAVLDKEHTEVVLVW